MTFIDNRNQGKEALSKATLKYLFQACILVEGQAVLLAPVKYGRLRDSIDYYVDEKELVGYVGTDVEYAIYVEFGTGEHAENGRGRKGGWVYMSPDGEFHFTTGMEPQPYLRPSFREKKNDLESLAKVVYSEI